MERNGERDIRHAPQIPRIGLETSVFAGDHVGHFLSAAERTASHQSGGTRLQFIFLSPYLLQAAVVLLERGIVHEEHQAHLQGEPVLTYLQFLHQPMRHTRHQEELRGR